MINPAQAEQRRSTVRIPGTTSGLWCETFWPGVFGCTALAPEARRSLLAAHPGLAPALAGLVPVERIYSDRVRSLLARVEVPPAARQRWMTERSGEGCGAGCGAAPTVLPRGSPVPRLARAACGPDARLTWTPDLRA